MTFDLTEKQQALRDAARRLALAKVTPAARGIDDAGEVPADLSGEAAALLAQATDPVDAALVLEELAAASASVALAAAIGAGQDDRPGLRGVGALSSDALDARTRLSVSAVALGVGRAALESALDECRRAGERPSGAATERPHWVLADAATEMDAARLLVWQGGQALGRGESTAEQDTALAQTLAIGAAGRAVEAALRIMGPDAYKRGSLLERLSRDARTLAFAGGTEEQQRTVAAGNLPA